MAANLVAVALALWAARAVVSLDREVNEIRHWWREVMRPMCDVCGEPLVWLDIADRKGNHYRRQLACREPNHRDV